MQVESLEAFYVYILEGQGQCQDGNDGKKHFEHIKDFDLGIFRFNAI